MDDSLYFQEHSGPTATRFEVKKRCLISPIDCYHIVVITNRTGVRKILYKNTRIAGLLESHDIQCDHFTKESDEESYFSEPVNRLKKIIRRILSTGCLLK